MQKPRVYSARKVRASFSPIPKTLGSAFSNNPASNTKRRPWCSTQAQFNPLRFTKGLALRIGGDRCRIHEATRVAAFDADSCRLTTDRGDITAGWIIFASHSPKGRLLLHGELACHREYGVAARLPDASLPPGIFWNAEEPFRSIRGYDFEGRAYVVVVGESHQIGRTDDTEQCYTALEEWLHGYATDLEEVTEGNEYTQSVGGGVAIAGTLTVTKIAGATGRVSAGIHIEFALDPENPGTWTDVTAEVRAIDPVVVQ